MRTLKVCHMTSAHPPEDVRIFHKECTSLANAGHEVFLVERGESYEKNGVHVVGVGEIPESRRKRMVEGTKRVYEKALSLDCDIYHLHDPELIPYGLKLKKKGKKVIFDSHEDVPATIMDKEWIPLFLRKSVAELYRAFETKSVRQLDAVVAATPYIAELFRYRAKRSVAVSNFPRLDDIVFHEKDFSECDPIVCYAGSINALRGEQIMIDALRGVEADLLIAGTHEKQVIENGSHSIRYLSSLDRAGINELYGKAVVGLCLLKPARNYVNSQPVKMFEYMAAGLPFVCSDFPLWRHFAEESGAGFCVDPSDNEAIRAAICRLLDDRKLAEEMGRRGRECVTARYSWSNEEKTLLELYRSIEEEL